MTINNPFDKDKKETEIKEESTPIQEAAEDGVVYVVNDDGTPFDTSDRTYVSVDVPEEGSSADAAQNNDTTSP